MVNVRKRGKVYQYQFEIGTINGKRKFINKSGFKTQNEAYAAEQLAYEKYINTLADILQHFFAPYLCLYFAV